METKSRAQTEADAQVEARAKEHLPGADRVGSSAVDLRARELRAHEGIVEVHNGSAISMPTPA